MNDVDPLSTLGERTDGRHATNCLHRGDSLLRFNADQGSWWSNELSTYNGKQPGNWVFYRGEFFRTPRAGTFTAHILKLRTTSEKPEVGFLIFKNLRLQAFK